MQCFVCGEQMRVVGVEPHVIDVRGFEFRTFQCAGCGDVETRTVFDRALAVRASAPLRETEATVPPPAPAPAAAATKMRSIVASLVRLRGTPQT
jgi:hypothetical protein